MTLSDKVRQVALTVAVGIVGVGIGYVANDIVEIAGEMRPESAAKEEASRKCIERLNQYEHSPSIRFLPPNSDVDNAIRIYGSGIFGLL